MMKAYNFAMSAFRRDVEGSLSDAPDKGRLTEVLEEVAQSFAESFSYSRSNGRPFESLDRHEDFWRGTGELDAAIDDACEVLEVSREPDESDDGREAE